MPRPQIASASTSFGNIVQWGSHHKCSHYVKLAQGTTTCSALAFSLRLLENLEWYYMHSLPCIYWTVLLKARNNRACLQHSGIKDMLYHVQRVLPIYKKFILFMKLLWIHTCSIHWVLWKIQGWKKKSQVIDTLYIKSLWAITSNTTLEPCCKLLLTDNVILTFKVFRSSSCDSLHWVAICKGSLGEPGKA